MINIELTQEIEKYISAGNLEPARQKLHQLIKDHPNDLTLREMLGQIYWKLEKPELAGQFWFLIEADSPEMVAATYAFVTECNNDSAEIFRRLEFDGEIGSLESEFAKYMLINLQGEMVHSDVISPEEAKSQAELDQLILPLNYEKRSPVRRTLLWAGCIFTLVTPVILLGLALFGVGRWFVGLF